MFNHIILCSKLTNDEFAFFDENYLNYSEKLRKCLLGGYLKDNKKNQPLLSMYKTDLVVLENAIKARNFVCHELLVDLVGKSECYSPVHIFKEQLISKKRYISSSDALAQYLKLKKPFTFI